MLRRALSVAVVAMLVGATTAEAHTLSLKSATKVAKRVSSAIATSLDGDVLHDGAELRIDGYGWGPCRRVSAHRVNCYIGHSGTILDGERATGFSCWRKLSIRYVSRHSRRTRWRTLARDCKVD